MKKLLPLVSRMAEALERLAPPAHPPVSFGAADAFLWSGQKEILIPVMRVAHVDITLLKGIEPIRNILLGNTARFAKGLPANSALLWGARGMGKSSLVKAIHADINKHTPHALVLIEIYREDLATLTVLLTELRKSTRKFILFCDDLSFDTDDASYKSLKAILDGGIEGRPANVLFYATSNRRHLMPRDMKDNEAGTAIHPAEAVEEKVSLSDRFGLWLGFHSCTQDIYMEMVESYAKSMKLKITKAALHAQAHEWAMTRGARSGRVAWQFIQDLAGRLQE